MFTKTFKVNIVVLILSLILGVFSVQPVHAEEADFDWAISLGGPDYSGGYAIDSDANGNIYVTGSFSGTVDFDPGAGTHNLTSAGGGDIFVGKYDNSGNLIWVLGIGNNYSDAGNDIFIDSNGNVYLVGSFSLTVDFDPGVGIHTLSTNGVENIFILKLDSAGDFVWVKGIGSSNTIYGYGIDGDESGNVLVTGEFWGTVDFDPGMGVSNLESVGTYDIFILKLDSVGNYIWGRSVGGTWDDNGLEIAVDENGNSYITGYFVNSVDFNPGASINNLTSAGAEDIFILKLDVNGDYLWAKNVGGENTDIGQALALDQTGVYFTGHYYGTADFDPGPGIGNLTSAGQQDAFVSKLDTNGNLIWAKSVGGSWNYDNSYSIALDKKGDIYATGSFYGTVDFDPGAGVYNLKSTGEDDIFILKLDKDGNFLLCKQLGGTSSETGFGIEVNGNDIYTTGHFRGVVDFDPSTGISNLTSAGYTDIFISKLITPPQIHYVRWVATGANNGSSWIDAYTDLQSALSAASIGDEIWVAAGTYKPTSGADRTVSFVLKNGVAVYGGFAGIESLRDQRNPVTNVTILSGDIGAVSDISDNSYHVVVSSDADNSSILDGFTVTAGNANGTDFASAGAGLLNNISDPTLRNIIFDSNSANSGGGMFNYISSPTLTDVTFQNNSAGYEGGGMVNDGGASPSLTNVTFTNNSANSGGGMYSGDFSNPSLTNVTLNNNTAILNGGGIFNYGSSPSLTYVTMNNNSASNGGGIYNNDRFSNPIIINTIIWGNIGGEIVSLNGSTPVVSYSVIQGGYAGGTNIINTDPLLGPLQNNGGFTQTMALLPGSPAIDAGDDANCPATDQRGVTRPFGSHCDIGAYEFNSAIINVTIGGNPMGSYALLPGQEKRLSFPVSGGPVKVESTNDKNIVSAIRLQSFANNTLYSFVETMGVPAGSLSSKYYFPTYNNTWAPLNSQVRFGNLDAAQTRIRVTIGGVNVWEQDVPGLQERRLTFNVSGGPVVIESLDPAKKIVAAIRLQSFDIPSNTLYSFSETMGIPDQVLSHEYYFPTYNNTWAPLNSQVRFGNLDAAQTRIRVTIGGVNVWEQDVPGLAERRLNFNVSGGPVKVESLDPTKKIVAAIRLQSFTNNTLYSFVETMGVPGRVVVAQVCLPDLQQHLGSAQLPGPLRQPGCRTDQDQGDHRRGERLGGGCARDWRRGVCTSMSAAVRWSSKAWIPAKKIVAAIRLQSYPSDTLFSFSETMGIPSEYLSDVYYFPTYNNTWAPLNSQLRFGVP